jgi:hypothetical protein
VLKKGPLMEKSLKRTDDFVIPAKAGIQGSLNYLIFKTKHWAPTPGLDTSGAGFAGVTPPRGFYCKVASSILFQHPAGEGYVRKTMGMEIQ